MIKLKRYLDSEGIKYNSFARNIGFAPSYVYKILHKILLPNLTAAIRIEEQTKGHVSVYDWDIKPKEKKEKNSQKKTKEKTETYNSEITVVLKP